MSKTKMDQFQFVKRMSADHPAEICVKPSVFTVLFRPSLSRHRM